MAGAIPILPTRDEYRAIQKLPPHKMAAFLTVFDIEGWASAREFLRRFGADNDQQPEKTEDTQ